MKKKIMLVFGTRPEAIKMCPLVLELQKHDCFEVIVCVTGQHRSMLQQVLDCFGVTPQYNLDIMKQNQTLFDITSEILLKIRSVLETERPDVLLVHGDTSTTFAAALAAFYLQIPVGHVEAGLRTYDLAAPFPEEFNRQAVGIVAKYNFAPTEASKENLLREGKDPKSIFVTGNTAIDALSTTVQQTYTHEELAWATEPMADGTARKFILLTAHRRENLGQPLHRCFKAIRRVMEKHPEVRILYPIHLNPKVREAANEEFAGCDAIRLIEPLEVLDFHNFIARADLILTDSGGIQEEAPSLGKPVLVLRETTERPEGVKAGTLKLVGSDEELIYNECCRLLEDKAAYESMSKASNPYGDGNACKRIAAILEAI